MLQHLQGLLLYDIVKFMKSTLNNVKKSKMGRPPVNSKAVTVRIHQDLLDKLDVYRKGMSRPEAIRKLIESGLE